MSTGFTTRVRELIKARSLGRCETCGVAKRDMQIHHRRPRRLGGSRLTATNEAANGLHLCGNCHQGIESDRELSYAHGLILWARQEPDEVAVMLLGKWWFLTNDGCALRAYDDGVGLNSMASGGNG